MPVAGKCLSLQLQALEPVRVQRLFTASADCVNITAITDKHFSPEEMDKKTAEFRAKLNAMRQRMGGSPGKAMAPPKSDTTDEDRLVSSFICYVVQ